MTKYDSQGVLILGFDNPAGTILYPNGLYSYSIGNTRARDISELLGTSKKQHLGPVQTSCFYRAELNSGIKFDKSTAEARRLNQTFELSSASN